ncbi:MAG: histidine phosphatase family protein [Actinobacteria bacterium]|nr:histidine phosphatase family protein [Actinomycetota bacterium]
MRLLLLSRHGQSVFNVQGVVNGDPGRDLGLSELGQSEAARLASQLAAVAIDACVVSSFPRAQQTARIALGDRRPAVAPVVDRDLDDIRVGQLEGRTLDDYREWKHAHHRADPFPGGESLDDAARRYAGVYERLLARPEETILCVCHEIPIRYAVNAAVGSVDFDSPVHDVANATPYLFDVAGLQRVVERMRELAGPTSRQSSG